jgi:hypothetical protein
MVNYSEFITQATNVENAYIALDQTPSGTESQTDIINAINTNLAELNLINNLSNISNNVNQEIIVKKNQLLRMQNNNLMKQLREIEDIDSIISTKNRIIEETNLNILKQELNIKFLIITIILAIILFIAVVGYSYQKITSRILSIIIGIIITIYLLILMYVYNIFYFRDAIIYLFFDKIKYRIGDTLKTWSKEIKNEIQTDIYGEKTDWVNNNCTCSANSEEEDTGIYATNSNITETEIPGYFSYNGSSPPQLLVPTPRQTPTLNLDQSIDWIDYSKNEQTNSYSLLHNSPYGLPNDLVNSETLTANM